jgi:hypothetical protein
VVGLTKANKQQEDELLALQKEITDLRKKYNILRFVLAHERTFYNFIDFVLSNCILRALFTLSFFTLLCRFRSLNLMLYASGRFM